VVEGVVGIGAVDDFAQEHHVGDEHETRKILADHGNKQVSPTNVFAGIVLNSLPRPLFYASYRNLLLF
jgi:hypothetical protein